MERAIRLELVDGIHDLPASDYHKAMSTRDFSMSGEVAIPVRRLDNDAPEGLRVELLNVIFGLVDETGIGPTEREIYNDITGCLGVQAAVNPYGGLCARASRHLCEAEWPRTFDVLLRLAPEFANRERLEEFRQAVNRVLAAYGSVWEIDLQGNLARVLPMQAEAQIEALTLELAAAEFQAARDLFRSAQDAYNAVPRRDRDACANAFDAMESVGLTRFGGTTFGDVVAILQGGNTMDRFTLSLLRQIEIVRHNHFGHGNASPFNLAPAEVEFVYLSCVSGTLLLCRL
jgi:hypothetical protein